LTLLILLSFTRIVTGIFSDKPVSQIIIVTIILIIIAIVFLHLLTEQISNTIIPELSSAGVSRDFTL
jgi:nitrate/nitrite transporter NarK